MSTLTYQAVESSNIKAIGHDEKTLTLGVKFKNKRTYHYQPITTEGYQAFLKAESKGVFFNEYIKNNPLIKCEEQH